MTQKPTQEDYDKLIEGLGHLRPIRGKLKLITADGIYELDTNFFPARVRKIESKEQEDEE